MARWCCISGCMEVEVGGKREIECSVHVPHLLPCARSMLPRNLSNGLPP